MFARFSLVFIFICLSFVGLSQTLSISSTGQTGTSGTNWTISGTTLTVSGTANIAGSVIESKLSSGSLSIVGNTSSLSVYINQTISSTTSGSGLTIGATNNAGTVILNNSLSIAGSLSIIAGRVSVLGTLNLTGSSSNLSVTSTNTVVNATSTIGGSASISAASNFILGTNISVGTGYPFTANGGFTKSGSGTSYLFSDIITSNTAVNFTGPVVIGNFNTSNTTTEIKTNGGALNIPGALSAYSGNGLAYTVLLYSYLYDADCAAVTGSSTDLYFRFNTGTHTFSGLPGISTPFSSQYLVVAGGGGGGSGLQFQYAGGGGGGGGVANGNYTFSGTPITIAVGQGGSQNTNGADSYLDNIKSGGGGAGGNYNYTIGLVGNGGAGYAAGGGGGGSGSNTGGGYAAGGTGTQRNGGNGAACCGDVNWGGSGGGSVGNAPTSPYVDGAGYSSNITGTTVVYGIGAKCQATAVAKTGGGGGSAAYGTVTGADGTIILRVTLSNASTLSAMTPSTALHLNAAAGAVTLSSTVSNLASLLVTADASSNITGPVTGTGSLTKAGTGILTLAGNHTYSGGTTVNAGTLKLDDTGPDDGNGVIVGTLNVNQNGTVQLAGLTSSLGWNTNRVTTLNINGGTVEAISGKQHIWNLTGGLNFNGGGTFSSNSGVSNAAATSYIEWGAGNITITNPTAPAIIAGRINLRNDFTGGAIAFVVNDGATEHDLLISAAITQTSAPNITKTGAGKMTFTGANSYSGTTTISAGVFQVGDGSTTGSISSGSVVNNASIIFKRSNDYTISNAISGSGTIEKLGAGILTFSGGNSYTGVSTVSQGVLKIGASNALGTIAGNTLVNDGAAIDLNGITLSVAEPLTINGTGLSSSGALYNSSTTAVTLPSPITLGSAALIKAGSANLTMSGSINGAFNLEVQGTNNSFTQSGIIGASSAPTSYTINTGTGAVTIGAAATIAGPVNMYGNTITFSSALTASGDLSLNANTAVTQSAAIIAAGLSLNGTGTFTLTNTSNNFATLAGGSTGSLLGATQIIDVSGGLTIGTVGSISGLTGSSTIRVETLAGNITLSGNISTTSTSTDAVILTSAKSTAIGVSTGGDIIVSGSPTITMGTGAIAKLFSGYDVTSTGLTTLAGGASNARYNYDETSTTYNPTLSANNKYAIYRTGLSYGDLTIVSSGGDTEGTTWTYTNGVIKTISGTANVLNTDIQTKLNSANLSIEANKVTFSANVTGTTSNTFSILSKTHILNTIATTITTQGGHVLFASNVDDATDGETTTNGYTQLRYGITINSNGGNITFGGGNTSGSDYSFGSSIEAYTEGIRFDGVIALNSSGGNIVLKGKSYAMGLGVGFGASGVGFYYFSAATGTINSGTGTITIDGFSQTNGSTYSSGFYCMNNLTITSANTTANAISISGKATGANGDAVGIETEGTFSVLATADGGGITIRNSQQIANFYDVLFRGETNILAKSGPIQLLGKQDGGAANGIWYNGNNFYLGSRALSTVPTSSSPVTIEYDRFDFSNLNPKIATSGTFNWRPASASFGQNVQTDWFSWNQNSQTLSGLTIGKPGNTVNVYPNSALTITGPVNLYGNTIGFTAALTASGDLSLYANTAVTQTTPIIAAGLSLNGTGTFTLNNASNNFTTLAGGATGSLLGATDIVDISGGLTIGTIGSNTGLTGSSTIRVETLAGNISLAGSISTTSTSSDAIILNAAKSTAIGIGTGGDIIVTGTPNITMGSGGIAKLYSGLEATSTGLTTLAGGSSNVRNNYDETSATFSPVLSSNNKYAIYRTSSGVGALTIVSTGGDAINSTWTYDNGVINTITTPVNILSSVIENYLSSGPLTINAGNTTVNAAITSTSSNALILNANSTLSNTTPTTTVNAAITNAGPITINAGAFNINHNISTTSAAAITISANNGFSTTTPNSTRYTISTGGGNITINADNDANGTGLVDIDDLTFNPGSANLIIRGETFNFNTTQTRKPYINGTGSFTFESNDAAFGQEIISNWFVLDQDANGMSGLTLGKSGSTTNVTLNSVFTVAGPITAYGGLISVSSAITSSATGDILLKGITNSGNCINITAGITKSSGTGTLTLQGHGRVNVSAAIAATGSASLNVILWSDFDGDNVGGGSTLSSGSSISTIGGHVWLGGSNSNGGSYNWNGLAVGDGPSTGASGANCNAIDLFGPITSAGGDVLLWASNNGGCGLSGIQSDGTRLINAGSGNITFISDQTAGAIELTSTGVISFLPEGGSYASALTLGGTLSAGNFTFNTSHYNGLKINSLSNSGLVIGNYLGHLSGTTAVTQGNSSNVTLSSALTTKSLEIYGGAIALNENITTTGTNADVLIKAMSNINLAAAKTITTAAGDVNLWADSDDNATGYVQLLAGAAINSTGGDINLGGGSDLTSDYAMGTTAETCPEVTGTQYISGVHFRQGSSLTSTNGNISVRGQNANTANSAMSFGISLRGVSMNAGTGKISLNGVATGTSGVNAQGVASWGTLTLRSANTSSDAISITGNALASTGSSSLGVNTVALFEATGSGGGIVITGKSGVASTNASVNISGDILAVSGPITLSGENFSGVQDNIFIGSTTVIGKKALSNVTTSSSNVLLEGNKIVTSGSVLVDCSGTLTVQPFGASFASALSWPLTNVTHASNLGGLTIGKTGNAANITIGAATSINGPITIYGGTLALNNALTTTNTTTGNLSLNGTTLSGSSTLTVANGRNLTMNLSSNTSYTGLINGNNLSFVKNGAGMLTLPTPTSLSFTKMTISGGTYRLNVNQQLTLSDTLVNNGTFLMRDGATFKQATSGTSVSGSGTFTVQKYLSDNSSTWSTTSGRFWYMGVPMANVVRSSYGTHGTTTNRVWLYSEATKSYTELSNANDVLSAGTGYVHRRSTNDTLTFTATGANGLYGSDYSVSGLTKTAGYTSGVHLVSNPYMGFLDWNAVYNASTNIDPTFYIRSNNTTGNNINALISYNGSTSLVVSNESSVLNTSNFRYIAPMQSIWVKVGAAAPTGTINMTRSMLSHQTGNALKSSTVFPTLARVNVVDGDVFDQLLVYMNSDMSNEVDQYDSEKFPVSGAVQVYTMASNKKLVMNGLKNNKKKVSVPLYLELPASKSYTIQLSEYVLEDGLILLEDKQEGTMQDFTLLENYTFYANSGQLHNRFVLHFILPNAELTTQGPSNNWVGPETSYTDGGNVAITNDDRGNIEITVEQAEDQKVEGNVTVTDMNGKEVYKGQLDGITTAISLNVPAGIYYLTVQSGTLFEKKKVFIQE